MFEYDPQYETKVETAKPLEPWRQVLLDAADYMEKHGKCEDDMGDRPPLRGVRT